MAPSLISRMFGSKDASLSVPEEREPRRLIDVKDGPVSLETKSSYGLLPRGAYGDGIYEFFSPDGGRTIIDISDGPTTIAFLAYWYCATRWKALKLSEAPLMVVAEDPDTGMDEWLPDHELAPLLETPSLDYDMGELIECTSFYLDNTGAALWVFDTNRNQQLARITPFSKREFNIKSDAERLYSYFEVQTRDGQRDVDAEEAALFKDTHGMMGWGGGKSRLDVAMSWLKLGAKAQQTIHDLLANSVWPSLLLIPDKDWNPDPKTYAQYQDDVRKYAKAGNKGKPFFMIGGGTAETLQNNIKDIIPGEILNRVESVVAAVSGVPAIVLQFEVGLANSPWSQMGEARKMAYDDVIQPSWAKMERVLTRQLLRPIDDDPTHFLRFDRTNIAALQRDQLESVQIATLMGRMASLNERRVIAGLEPVDKKDDPDGQADKIPELTQPTLDQLLAGNGGKPGANPSDNPKDVPPQDQTQGQDAANQAKKQSRLARQLKAATLLTTFREEQQVLWSVVAAHNLKHDVDNIVAIVDAFLTPATQKSVEAKVRGKDRAMSAVARYLDGDGKKQWTKTVGPVALRSAQRSGALLAADMNFSFNLINNNLTAFAAKQAAAMIKSVNSTTRSLVNDIIQGGIDANASTAEVSRLIRESTGFAKARADLIARTETTKAFNGAPEEALTSLGERTGRSFTKTWSGVLDDKERDEHVAMEGETVAVGESFSNGLDYPSEPNCRCTLIFDEVTE